MKLTQYMQYLKILHDRYGDIDVKVKTIYEFIGAEDFKNDYGYIDAHRPKYDKNKKCVVIHKDFVSLSFD